VNFEANSDNFVSIPNIAQGVAKGMRIREVPISTRYFDEASQIGFWKSVRYGLEILKEMVLYKMHKKRIWSHRFSAHQCQQELFDDRQSRGLKSLNLAVGLIRVLAPSNLAKVTLFFDEQLTLFAAPPACGPSARL